MNTRKNDLLTVLESRRKAKNAYERDMADRALGRIKSESKQVESIREKLIGAVRNKDHRALRRFEHELMMIQANKTYGHDY